MRRSDYVLLQVTMLSSNNVELLFYISDNSKCPCPLRSPHWWLMVLAAYPLTLKTIISHKLMRSEPKAKSRKYKYHSYVISHPVQNLSLQSANISYPWPRISLYVLPSFAPHHYTSCSCQQNNLRKIIWNIGYNRRKLSSSLLILAKN